MISDRLLEIVRPVTEPCECRGEDPRCPCGGSGLSWRREPSATYLSPSRVSLLASCPRKYWWRYIKQFEVPTPAPLIYGGAVQAALVHGTHVLDQPSRFGVTDPAEGEWLRLWGTRVVEAYKEKYEPNGPPEGLEVPLAVKLADPTEMTPGGVWLICRADAIDGADLIENKLVSAIREWDPHSDLQTMALRLAAREMGLEIRRVRYRQTRKPRKPPQFDEAALRTAAAYKPVCDEQTAELSPEDPALDELHETLVQWAAILAAHGSTNMWPANLSACTQYGKCEYYGVCRMGEVE